MPDLIASTPLPVAEAEHGAALLTVLPRVPLFWIAPYPGRTEALSAALQSALGVSFPAPGDLGTSDAAEIRWAGRDHAILISEATADLAEHACVTEVSDVYVRLHVGPREVAAAVLARLVPLDLRPERFPAGRTARSLLGHVPAHLTAREDGIELLVMRSFAHTAFHEIETAMESVAGRAALS